MKTVLLTGAAGFIATHVRRLLDNDASTLMVDTFEPRVHGEDPKRFEWTERGGVMRRRAGFVFPYEMDNIDTVIHLAAQVGVADSMTDPMRYIYENTLDTTMLMERLKQMKTPPKRIVVASSMSVYGDPMTSEPITEEHPVRPASIYGLSKYDQEKVVMLLGELLGAEVIALRFFNVYGPGQALSNPYTGVLANFANWILKGEAPLVYEDGLQTRDFIYVEDVARAVVAAAQGALPGGVYNVCTGVASTILDVAECLSEALESSVAPRVTGTTRPGDIRHAVGDPTKLREVLGTWNPLPVSFGMLRYAAALAPGRRLGSPSTAPQLA
jgi:dTDP-L-rhamnose 4-epimerase